ncbi:tetratricopeptide repeat-containing sensor histidine kinase [Marivirga sp.]|uniref:tetratricopeptide repeat-containing sensor histidine kinase n=1 Tax=Marivirga sp. TaxID=2018662 RepID=UPI002D7FCCBD|nr:tetratricopeptide repeat-containing sensor histidine kinase [Marivirga sp.]HET8860925.1 tetratricopeptide repeat-containing sensor histidine kinase [Marivirga sp.]
MSEKNKNTIQLTLLLLVVTSLLNLNLLKAQNSVNDSAVYYISIAKENWHNDLQKSHNAAYKAFKLIPRINNIDLIADAYAQYGVSFYTNLEYDSAIFYYKKAVNTIESSSKDYYRYISYLCSALEKKGLYKNIFDIIDNQLSGIETNNREHLRLLFIRLSAAIKIGYSTDAESIIKQIEKILPNLNEKYTSQEFTKLKGEYFHLVASYEKSDSIFHQLKIHYDSVNNSINKAEIFLLLAQNSMEVSKYKESSKYLIKSQAIYESINYEYGIANINLNTGTLLSWMQMYDEASDYIFKALEVFEENKNLNDIQIAYYELGWIYQSLKLEERSKKYLNEALTIAGKIQNIKYLGREHNAFGSLYTSLEKYDSALMHFDSAIYYQNISKNIKELSAAKFNKAVVLDKLGKDNQALELYRESYKVDLKLNHNSGLIEGEWVLGEYFMKKNQLDSAIHYFNLGEKRAVELGEKYFLLKIYEAQATLANKRNNYKLSSEYLQKALKAQKELSEENKTLDLATVETMYDLKNKEKELALLNLQKENNEQTIALNKKTIESQQNTLIVLATGIILLLIISYIIFRYLKVKTKTNHQLRELYSQIQEKQEEIMAQSEELKEANDYVHELNQFLEERVKERTIALENALSELDYFFYRASHDFRGPLTTLMGLVGLSKTLSINGNAGELFEKVDITAKKLDGMVKKLQSVSFLGEFKNLKSPKNIILREEILKIYQNVLENVSSQKQKFHSEIKINTNIQEIFFYPRILEICIFNLLENSIIFNDNENIHLNITAEANETELIISIEDNGLGIHENIQSEIFNMFKRSSHASAGNGLGLYLVKKAVDNLNGKILLRSKERIGSKFTIFMSLPEHKNLP